MKDKKKDRRCGDHFVDHYATSLSYGRRKRGRIHYLSWAIELYGCSDDDIGKGILRNSSGGEEENEINEAINREVRKAVEELPAAEKRFVELFYFEFKSYRQIAIILKKKVYKLERIHQRALGKLRILLTDFVKKRFRLEITEKTDCPICSSPFREELDQLIREKKEEETHKPLINILKKRYGIDIRTPQVIIGHRKKHMV
jgi:hypothetical protein